MASLVALGGLTRIGAQASQATGAARTYSATRHIQTMSIDDQSSGFLSTDVDLDRAGGLTVANMFDQAFSPTPTFVDQTVTHTTTIPTGSGNFTTRRIATHDDTAANVSVSSDTLVSGVDGVALQKTSDFSMTPTLKFLFSSV